MRALADESALPRQDRVVRFLHAGSTQVTEDVGGEADENTSSEPKEKIKGRGKRKKKREASAAAGA